MRITTQSKTCVLTPAPFTATCPGQLTYLPSCPSAPPCVQKYKQITHTCCNGCNAMAPNYSMARDKTISTHQTKPLNSMSLLSKLLCCRFQIIVSVKELLSPSQHVQYNIFLKTRGSRCLAILQFQVIQILFFFSSVHKTFLETKFSFG